MKQKIILLSILLVGIFINLNAQEENERARAESRERARVTSRAIVEPRVAIGSTGVEVTGAYVPYGRDEQRVSLNLSKHFAGEESISSEAEFEVMKGQSAISLNLSGSCSEGEITIIIIQPNGDTMKSQKITNAADITWSTMFPISEEDEKKYVGKWKLKVETDNAYGRYNLNISSR